MCNIFSIKKCFKPLKLKGLKNYYIRYTYMKQKGWFKMLFKKKEKHSGIRVMHYEGIDAFATDYPCTLEMKDDVLIIKRIKPETTVTLPVDRIQSISAMEEERFMLKYHGEAKSTSKMKGVKKYYLVINYDKGRLAFWGTAKEYGVFIKMQYGQTDAPSEIML